MTTPAELLTFWFGALEDGFADAAHRERWFRPDAGFDSECQTRFSMLLDPAAQGALDGWLTDARGRLAFILLCDQLPRNIHRGTAAAFAWDSLALSAAREGVAQGTDRDLAYDERSFFYLPFEHSEDLLDQHLAVGLFSLLRDETPAPRRNETGNYLRFAQQHRDIVLRFGRFPHRNDVLGRQSTAAEQTFVDAGDGFGQRAP